MQNRILSVFIAIIVCTVGWSAEFDVRWNELKDVEGASLAESDVRFRVICFLGVECPLARLYAPRLEKLAQDFQPKGFPLTIPMFIWRVRWGSWAAGI